MPYTKFQLRCIKLGLCVECGDNAAGKYRRCMECRSKRQKNSRGWKAKQKRATALKAERAANERLQALLEDCERRLSETSELCERQQATIAEYAARMEAANRSATLERARRKNRARRRQLIDKTAKRGYWPDIHGEV